MALPSKLTSPLPTVSVDNPDVGAELNKQLTVQNPAYAATITVDPTKGDCIVVGTLTGNITVNLPASYQGTLQNGQRMTIEFVQDATGGRTLTLGAGFKAQAGGGISTVASKTSVCEFRYDGSQWVQTTVSAGM